MKIVLGTSNPSKVKEINEIANSAEIEFIPAPEGFAPEETGSSFEENSLIKATEAARLSKNISLADDSGLCIEALNGAPGLYSARYAGTQKEKIARVLNELEGSDSRKAKFVCTMSLVDENQNLLYQTKGECHGKIVFEPVGTNGFGYDPIFMPDDYEITIAQMSDEQKNSISHRGRALSKMLDFIKTLQS